MTNRYLERLDRPLTLDEVREGTPDLGWKLIRDQYHDVSEGDAEGHHGVQANLYRVLVFESESGRVALVVFFNPDTLEMQMMEFEHLLMEGVALTAPNVDSTVPSAAVVEQVLGRRGRRTSGELGGISVSDRLDRTPTSRDKTASVSAAHPYSTGHSN